MSETTIRNFDILTSAIDVGCEYSVGLSYKLRSVAIWRLRATDIKSNRGISRMSEQDLKAELERLKAEKRSTQEPQLQSHLNQGQ